MQPGKTLNAIRAAIEEHDIIRRGRDRKIIAACSGGPDSMLLLHALFSLRSEYGFEIIPVHINHLLRKSASPESSRLFNHIQERYGLNLRVFACSAKDYSAKEGMGIEEAGRELRKKILGFCARSFNAGKIALGHHRDDQVETVLFRILRGTGIKGLGGMKPVSGQYIRPLFFLSKTDILDAAKSENIFYIEDESNYSLDFSRNVLRHTIIPLFRQVNEGAENHIFELSRRAWEAEDYLAGERKNIIEKFYLFGGKGFQVYKADMLRQGSFLGKEAVRAVYEAFTGSMSGIDRRHTGEFYEQALKKTSFRMNFPGDVVFIRAFEVVIAKQKEFRFNRYEIKPEEGDNLLPYDLGSFRIQKVKGKTGIGGTDLRIRAFMPGDVYKGKKLKVLFLEKRLPREFRHIIPFIAKGNEVLYLPLADGASFLIAENGSGYKIDFEEGELYSKIINCCYK